MELYRKKINLAGKPKQKYTLRNIKQQVPNYKYDVYLQKSIQKQNLGPQNNPINLSCVNESIPNFRSSMQDLFSNDETRKKAIKYVIHARRKSPSPESTQKNSQKNGNNTSRQPKIRNLLVSIDTSPEIEKKYKGLNKENIKEKYCLTNANTSRRTRKKKRII